MSLLSSVGAALGGDLGEPKPAQIKPKEGLSEKFDRPLTFQYFPETINDTKGAEYASNSMPGSSHPIKTWVAGTDRVISFQAVFTQDKNPQEVNAVSVLTGGFELSMGGATKHTVEVEKQLAILRSYILPYYKNGIAYPPPTLQLVIPGSKLVSAGKVDVEDSLLVLLTQCDITYESFHRNGAMRIATVALSFVETVQSGDNWGYQDRESYLRASKVIAEEGTVDQYFKNPVPRGRSLATI